MSLHTSLILFHKKPNFRDIFFQCTCCLQLSVLLQNKYPPVTKYETNLYLLFQYRHFICIFYFHISSYDSLTPGSLAPIARMPHGFL